MNKSIVKAINFPPHTSGKGRILTQRGSFIFDKQLLTVPFWWYRVICIVINRRDPFHLHTPFWPPWTQTANGKIHVVANFHVLFMGVKCSLAVNCMADHLVLGITSNNHNKLQNLGESQAESPRYLALRTRYDRYIRSSVRSIRLGAETYCLLQAAQSTGCQSDQCPPVSESSSPLSEAFSTKTCFPAERKLLSQQNTVHGCSRRGVCGSGDNSVSIL